MRAADRRRELVTLLTAQPVSVDDLAARFEVSASTIRRDLDRLTESGEVLRTYGGATFAGPVREHTSDERLTEHAQAKQAIARLAAALVPDDAFVLLDAGTTVGALAQELVDRQLAVITNNLIAAHRLEHADGVALTMIGGSVRRVSSGTLGPTAEATVAAVSVDVAFLGCDTVDPVRGLGERTDEQASLKRRMVHSAHDVVVLADSSKLVTGPAVWWTPMPQRWTLITDALAPAPVLDRFREVATVLVADPAAP